MSWTTNFASAWEDLEGIPAQVHPRSSEGPPSVEVETRNGEQGRVLYTGHGATLVPAQGSEQELWDVQSPIRCAALVAALLAS